MAITIQSVSFVHYSNMRGLIIPYLLWLKNSYISSLCAETAMRQSATSFHFQAYSCPQKGSPCDLKLRKYNVLHPLKNLNWTLFFFTCENCQISLLWKVSKSSKRLGRFRISFNNVINSSMNFKIGITFGTKLAIHIINEKNW